MKILAINGSYRKHGITDQTVDVVVAAVAAAGAEVETVVLRDTPIEFCTNCRACTQEPGTAPGLCVLQDSMQGLIDKIEAADAYILAAPTNQGSVTALFRRFMERLAVYAWWPWSMNGPQFRKAKLAQKKALLISSCAAPGLLGRLLYHSRKQLQTAARAIGAREVATLFIGLIAKHPHPQLSDKARARAETAARQLIGA